MSGVGDGKDVGAFVKALEQATLSHSTSLQKPPAYAGNKSFGVSHGYFFNVWEYLYCGCTGTSSTV